MNWNLFLHYFANALLSVKYKLLVLLIITSALLGVYVAFEKPSYKTSWIVLLPGTERNSTINLDNLGEARSNGGNVYGSVSISPKNTYKEIALSDAVIDNAAQEYGVPATAFSKPRITLIDQTPAMKFTLVGESKDELVYRAGLYNDTFHNTLDMLRKNEIERHHQGIENNLSDAKKRLAQARLDVVTHQTNTRFISDEQFNRWMGDTETLRTEKTQAQVHIAQLNARIGASLKQLGITPHQAESLFVLLSSPSIQAILARLGDQTTLQISLRSQFASQNPMRKKVDREVSALSRELRQALSAVPELEKISDVHLFGLLSENTAKNIQTIANWLAENEGLNAQEVALEASQKEYQTRIKMQTVNAARLADLQRDHQIAEAIFSSALAKLDTSRLDIYATYPLTQLLTQPGATVTRDRLQTKLVIVAGIMIFGLLSLALVLTQMRKTLISHNEKNQNIKRKIAEKYNDIKTYSATFKSPAGAVKAMSNITLKSDSSVSALS